MILVLLLLLLLLMLLLLLLLLLFTSLRDFVMRLLRFKSAISYKNTMRFMIHVDNKCLL
jgi:hypothetical protein